MGAKLCNRAGTDPGSPKGAPIARGRQPIIWTNFPEKCSRRLIEVNFAGGGGGPKFNM